MVFRPFWFCVCLNKSGNTIELIVDHFEYDLSRGGLLFGVAMPVVVVDRWLNGQILTKKPKGVALRVSLGVRGNYCLGVFIGGQLSLLNVLTIMINTSKQVCHGANTCS